MSGVFNPAEIEREITLLQRKLSPSETRAMLFNFVIFSSEEEEQEVDKVLAYILGKRPARIIHIQQSQREKSDIEVSARCYPDRENRGVCFQEIIIRNGKDGTGIAPGSWTPLLIRDIPVYLWWTGSFTTSPDFFERAKEHCDKILLDSNRSSEEGEADPQTVYRNIIVPSLKQDIPVADISWRRLSPLRKATAHLFDSEDLRPSLYSIQHLQFRSDREAEAMLYLRWIAVRLGWTAVPGRTYFTDRDGDKVSWEHAKPSGESEIAGVKFVLRSWDELTIQMHKEGYATLSYPGARSYTLRCATPSDGEIILEELDYLYHDYLFAEVARSLTARPSR